MKIKPLFSFFTTYGVEAGIAYTETWPLGKKSVPLQQAMFEPLSLSSIKISSSGNELIWDRLADRKGVMAALEAEREKAMNFIVHRQAGMQLQSNSGTFIKKNEPIVSSETVYLSDGHYESVNAVAFSPSGKLLASISSDYTIKVWSVETGRLLRTLETKSYGEKTATLAFARDNTKIIFGFYGYDTDGNTKVFEANSWNFNQDTVEPLTGYRGYKYTEMAGLDGGLAFNGEKLAISSYPWAIKLLKIPTSFLFKLLNILSLNALSLLNGNIQPIFSLYSIQSVGISPDGRNLISASDRHIRLWDISKGRLNYLRSISRNNQVDVATVSNNGRKFALISKLIQDAKNSIIDSRHSKIEVWNIGDEKPISYTVDDCHYISIQKWRYRIEFNNDGSKLIFNGEDGVPTLFSTSENHMEPLCTFDSEYFCVSVAFNPNGGKLAAGYADGTIKLWDVHTGKEIFPPDKTILMPPHKAARYKQVIEKRGTQEYYKGHDYASYKNYSKAVEYWYRAAEHGNVKALMHLFDVYERPEIYCPDAGIEKDSTKSVEFLCRAAELGDEYAMSLLATSEST